MNCSAFRRRRRKKTPKSSPSAKRSHTETNPFKLPFIPNENMYFIFIPHCVVCTLCTSCTYCFCGSLNRSRRIRSMDESIRANVSQPFHKCERNECITFGPIEKNGKYKTLSTICCYTGHRILKIGKMIARMSYEKLSFEYESVLRSQSVQSKCVGAKAQANYL